MGLFAQHLSPMHGISHACSILAAGYITPISFYHSSTSSKHPFHSVSGLQSQQKHIHHSHAHFLGTWSIPSMSFVFFLCAVLWVCHWSAWICFALITLGTWSLQNFHAWRWLCTSWPFHWCLFVANLIHCLLFILFKTFALLFALGIICCFCFNLWLWSWQC